MGEEGGESTRVGGIQSVSQAGEKKVSKWLPCLARCWCIEKNHTSKDHSAPFTFWDHPGCSSLGETGVTMAMHADGNELVHLRRHEKKHSAKEKNTLQEHI